MNRLLSFQSRCMQSVIRLNEAVVAIIAAVDNIDRLRLLIAEDEEIVVQEVHLHDGFLDIHRLDDEVFRLDDLIGIALIVYIRQRARLELLRLELAGTQAAYSLMMRTCPGVSAVPQAQTAVSMPACCILMASM